MVNVFLWVAVIVIAIVLFVYAVIIFNGLVHLRNNIKKAAANIDVLLKQRSDELPNLVETVKAYASYEKQTLSKLTRIRTAALQASSMGQKAAAENQLEEAFKSLFAVAENYPELKANTNFLQLQKRLSELETSIADRRAYYNNSVNNFNARIQSIPDIVVARALNYAAQEFFEASDEDRKVVGVRIS